MAGFGLQKGLAPVLPIYRQAILTGLHSVRSPRVQKHFPEAAVPQHTGGGAEIREAAAEAIGELVSVTSEESVKPFIITITGPLIRVISDKFQWQVRTACKVRASRVDMGR